MAGFGYEPTICSLPLDGCFAIRYLWGALTGSIRKPALFTKILTELNFSKTIFDISFT